MSMMFFDPNAFHERIGEIRGTHKGRQFDETVKPIALHKLHGSLGWYECPILGVRRCSSAVQIPASTKRLMVPPQYRKATDTMQPPYAALWSAFRGALSQDAHPVNRLVCVGYGFMDEHVNAVIENGLARTDFTLLIFAKLLSDAAWSRWSVRTERDHRHRKPMFAQGRKPSGPSGPLELRTTLQGGLDEPKLPSPAGRPPH